MVNHFTGALPFAIKLGDYNRDGFPDLLLTVIKGTDTTIRVLTSMPCDSNTCGKSLESRRTFVSDQGWASKLSQVPGEPLSAIWLDLDDDVNNSRHLIWIGLFGYPRLEFLSK